MHPSPALLLALLYLFSVGCEPSNQRSKNDWGAHSAGNPSDMTQPHLNTGLGDVGGQLDMVPLDQALDDAQLDMKVIDSRDAAYDRRDGASMHADMSLADQGRPSGGDANGDAELPESLPALMLNSDLVPWNFATAWTKTAMV